jgi:hypothetical protein
MQHVHLDHSPLFEADEISTRLPPHAVTVVIPLIDIDLHCGTTAVWEGTHRMVGARQLKDRLNRSPDLPGASFPTPKMGGCYLMDYRLVHGGTPNNSDRPRTILYLVYSRPWFRDAANFGGQPAVLIEPDQLGKIPDQFRSLFRFVVPR